MPWEIFWTIVAGVFGLLVGSFLNVCIFRLPRNCMSVVRPRSRCPKCLALVRWFDNIPVFSWLALGGKCRSCREPISPRYAFVELLTGAFFAYAAWVHLTVVDPQRTELVFFVVEIYLVSAMIVSTFIDLDLRILPDEITISGVILGVVVSAALPWWHMAPRSGLPAMIGNEHFAGLTAAALGAMAGGGVIYVVGVAGKFVFRKEAMGFGDVKYMAFLGAFLGWKSILMTLFLACLFGSLYGIGKVIVTRRMGYVPFGPFLSMGGAVMVFWSGLVYWLAVLYLQLMQRITQWFVDWLYGA